MTDNPLTPPADFVGRRRELTALASHLLDESSAGLAFVHGPSGVGKTALIAAFAQMNGPAFLAGVHYVPSWFELNQQDDATSAAEILADHLEPQGPYSRGLVVLEEVAAADPIAAAAFVETIRSRRPETRFILSSQLALPMPAEWLDLELGGLSKSELSTLLKLKAEGLTSNDLGLLLAHADGNPLLATTIADLSRRGSDLEHLLELLAPATYPGLLGPDGRPLDPGSPPPESVTLGLRAVSADLVEHVREDPNRVHSLSPRAFEELVAALYEKQGFEVELTPASHDGGVDLYAVRYESYGKVLTIVECKRNAPHRPVGVELIRSLHGVVEDKGASVGVLATSSSFTAGAKDHQQRHSFRLALQDWLALQQMME